MPKLPIVFRNGGARPRRLGNLLRSGDAANRGRSWREAATAYRAVLEIDPSLTHIWVQYGHSLKEQGYLQDAEQAYRRAIALNPKLPDTHLQLGHVLKLEGRLDDAANAYVTAHRLGPELQHPRLELDALGLEMPSLRYNVFTADPEFVAAVYGCPDTPYADGSPAAIAVSSETRYASSKHALNAHGLSANILRIFDFRYYFYANPVVRSALNNADRHRCLLHFCEHGIANLLPCSETFSFDAEFYNDAYLARFLSPANAYWHWLSVGFDKGWPPNREKWLKEKLGAGDVTLSGFDFAPCIAYFYPEDRDARWIALFTRFIENDVLRPGPHLPVTDETATLFAAIANWFVQNGRLDNAIALYERILFSVPHHRIALHSYADCLRDKGQFLEAERIYALLIDRNEASVWCFLHRASCYEALGDLRNALACLRHGTGRFPEESLFRQRFDAVADRFFIAEWELGTALGKIARYHDAQQRLGDACGFLASLMDTKQQLPVAPVRAVAIIASLDLPQCVFYRVEQKIEHLRAAGYLATVYDFFKELPDFLADITQYQAVIFYRVPATPRVINAIYQAKEFGIRTFYDIDDFIFGGEDYPGSFESFFNQITLSDYVGLKLGVPVFRQAIALCDFGIASTPALANEMAQIVPGGEAFVHRNAFGRKQEMLATSLPVHRTGDRVTIFYGSGTKSHKEDFRDLVEPALVETVRRYRDRVGIVLVGYTVLTPALESIRENLTIVEPVSNIDDYWAILKSADINIAVLKKTPMNHCKSEIKWLEAAMFGIPSIVSGTATYDEVIEAGITGLICNTQEEWTAALDLLVRDGDLRRHIGLAAWHRVRDAYSICRMGENLTSIFARTTPPPTLAVRPKVIIVNVFYPPQPIGGATRVVYDNVMYLSQHYGPEFDVEVFTTGWGAVNDYELRCYVHQGVRVTAVSRPMLWEVEHAIGDEKMAGIFGEYLDRTAPTMVHFHCIQRLTSSIVEAASARGLPYLITVHDGWWISDVQFIVNEKDESELYDYTDPIKTGLKWGGAAYRRMMRLKEPLFGATKVLAVSEQFADLYHRCGVPRVVAMPNGIADIDRKPRTRSPDGRVRLAFLGGIGFSKGYGLIKYALLSGRFANLRLAVIEDALPTGGWRHEVWNTTPVEFLPRVPENRVGELYAAIDVLLAPSVCIESFGLVTREALHCGCWVVASNRGSIGECVVEGRNGHVIDVTSPDDLVRVLTMINDNPERYREPPLMKSVLRRSSEQADELAALYRSMISSSAAISDGSSKGNVDDNRSMLMNHGAREEAGSEIHNSSQEEAGSSNCCQSTIPTGLIANPFEPG